MEGTATHSGRWARAWGAFVDASPVLARELLVTARTPAYAISVVAAPASMGLLVLLMRMTFGPHLEPYEAQDFLSVYLTGLSLVLGVVGATLGSTVIVQEREAGTLDALRFSSLMPGDMVVGKFIAVILAEAAIAVGSLPLAAFIAGLEGVAWADVVAAMAIAMVCGALTASVGIAVSAHVAHARRASFFAILASSLVGIGVLTWLWLVADLGRSRGPFEVGQAYLDSGWTVPQLAVLIVLPAYAIVTLLWFGYASAVSGLMDRTEDRTAAIKRWAAGTLLAGTLILAAFSALADENARTIATALAMMATTALGIALLFVFSGEAISPSRRMQAHAPSSLSRLLFPRCLFPSLLFALIASGSVLVLLPSVTHVPSGVEGVGVWAAAFLAALGGLMGAVAARRSAKRARILGGAALVAFILAIGLGRDGGSTPTWADALCPLWLLGRGDARAHYAATCSLWGWASLAVLSVASMATAVRASRRRRA